MSPACPSHLTACGGENARPRPNARAPTPLLSAHRLNCNCLVLYTARARRTEAALEKVKLELKATQRDLAAVTRRSELAEREKERVSTELFRALERAQKMENLCRELQNQRELTFNENRRLLEDEQTKRQAQSRKFSSMVKDIQKQLDDREQDRTEQQKVLERQAAIAKENLELHARLTAVLEKDVLREQAFARQLHAKELEAQLANARQKQTEELLKVEQERARLITERAAVSEAHLQEQLHNYATKYDSFSGALASSTEGLNKLRAEMERSGKRTRALERENEELRARLGRVTEQRARLEGLCRSLQEECRRSRERAGGAEACATDAAAPAAEVSEAEEAGKGLLQEGADDDASACSAEAQVASSPAAAELSDSAPGAGVQVEH